LGEMGAGNGGETTFLIRDENGKFIKSVQSFHYHFEIYAGKWATLPGLGKKPYRNFNGVVR